MKGVTVISAMDVHESSPAKIAAQVREIVGSSPVYLSFDIDALDPGNCNGNDPQLVVFSLTFTSCS